MSKTALVTGASGGIGRAICVALAAKGFDIAVHYNGGEQRAQETAELVRALGRRAEVIKADVSKPEECAALVRKSAERLGGLYALVNNAGTTADGLIMRMSDEQYSSVMKANIDSCFFCTREALSLMLRARKGKIVNMTSVIGIIGNAGQANYAASKAAVIGLTKSTAREVASRGICVNAVAPGFIVTAMTDVLDDKLKEKMKSEIPLARFGTPEDVANTVAFLCGEEASYITGQVMVVDGGMVM
ncbi:MAG: 3-oxoacyl-[acyl-carrier-protein] reductase [Christensenellales bacterium]|jgi:3-oxoacyl-[acyl-carrier protein] reductase